jgi:23S rRNA (uracil1939-C5)-methyltransferase
MLTIESLTHLGLGRADDGTHIPRVLPGEVLDDDHRIITPSVRRVAATCRHFKTCGGCAMQHADDALVAEWKQSIVERALLAHGLTPEFTPMHTSPAQSRRRAKFSGRRTKKGATVGFHTRMSDMLVQVPDCKLLKPALIAAIPALEALTVLAASRKGEIALTVTETLGGIDVLIKTDQKLTSQLRIDLAAVAQQYKLARLTWVDETIVTLQSPAQTFGVATVTPPPGAFLQATQDGEAAILAAVTAIVLPAKHIVDLFAGVGTFALPLARHAEVHAVEGEAPMIAALDQGWRKARNLHTVTSVARDLFRRPLEPDELARYDAAVIDPPRAGAESQIATLAVSKVRKIAMVSCNPVTFGRDAATLVQAGYTLDWVQVVDQFRWSSHVEMVGKFTRD